MFSWPDSRRFSFIIRLIKVSASSWSVFGMALIPCVGACVYVSWQMNHRRPKYLWSVTGHVSLGRRGLAILGSAKLVSILKLHVTSPVSLDYISHNMQSHAQFNMLPCNCFTIRSGTCLSRTTAFSLAFPLNTTTAKTVEKLKFYLAIDGRLQFWSGSSHQLFCSRVTIIVNWIDDLKKTYFFCLSCVIRLVRIKLPS